jgi:hypothetical protein
MTERRRLTRSAMTPVGTWATKQTPSITVPTSTSCSGLSPTTVAW